MCVLCVALLFHLIIKHLLIAYSVNGSHQEYDFYVSLNIANKENLIKNKLRK